MKQYFLKYIPVKGEEKRKTGSTVSNEVGICLREEVGGYDYYQKVELFLCSRDVSLHEECWLDNEKVIPNQLHVDLRNKCYKVIGSISPEATWVDEDDEFDEDEIRRLTEIVNIENDFGEPSPNGWVAYPIEKVLETYWNDEPDYFSHKIMSTTCWKDAPEEVQVEVSYNIFEIKGPCGHFH